MADETLYASNGMLSILRGGSEHLRDSDIEIVKLTSAAKVGMALTSTGMSDPMVEILTTGDTFRGLLMGPVIRPSDSWAIDDDIAANSWVYMLKPTGGRLLVSFLASGYDTPLACLAGYHVTNTIDSAVTNASPGSLYPDITEITTVSTIGRIAEDFTTGNSTAAISGVRALMWY